MGKVLKIRRICKLFGGEQFYDQRGRPTGAKHNYKVYNHG